MLNRSVSVVMVSSALLAAASLLIATSARASEARAAGLGGNPMVVDMVDIAELPGLVAKEGNSLFLNVTQAAPFGDAGFLLGERFVAGAWVNRRLKWRDLDKTGELFVNVDLPNLYNLFDFFIGTRIGFGLRLSLQAGLDARDGLFVTNSSNQYSDGASALGVEIAPGYTIARPSYQGDIGAGVSLTTFRVAENGSRAYTNGWAPSFFLRHRSTIGPRERVTNWVVDFYLTRRAYGVDAQGGAVDEGRFGHWNTKVVVGPKLNLPKDFTVWGGLQVEFEYLSGTTKVASTAGGSVEIPQPKVLGIGVPGVVLSAELMVFDFLSIRAGVNYDVYWTIVATPDASDSDGDNDRTETLSRDRTMGQRFNWSTGLGVALGDFEIDGTVTQAFWFDGPDVIGGRAPGFLGIISATYMW